MNHPDPRPARRRDTLTRANVARVLSTATEPLTAEDVAGILLRGHQPEPRHVRRCERLMRQRGANP